MSTVPRKRPTRSEADFFNPYAIDPEFPFGFRHVYKKDAQGRRKLRTQALTRRDVLHPRDGDHQMNGEAHDIDAIYLRNVFQAQLADDPTALVLHDVGVYWGKRGLRHHSPDVSVILGVRPGRRRKDSFRVKREGVKPHLLLEVTSHSTRVVDLGEKVVQYYEAGVPYYIIVDNQIKGGDEDAPRRLRLIGFRRGKEGFVRMPLNRQRRLWLETVKVWVAIEDERVVCYDEAGNRIPDFAESQRRLKATEDRVAELEAELRRLRGDE